MMNTLKANLNAVLRRVKLTLLITIYEKLYILHKIISNIAIYNNRHHYPLNVINLAIGDDML